MSEPFGPRGPEGPRQEPRPRPPRRESPRPWERAGKEDVFHDLDARKKAINDAINKTKGQNGNGETSDIWRLGDQMTPEALLNKLKEGGNGNFKLKDAATLDELLQREDGSSQLRKVDSFLGRKVYIDSRVISPELLLMGSAVEVLGGLRVAPNLKARATVLFEGVANVIQGLRSPERDKITEGGKLSDLIILSTAQLIAREQAKLHDPDGSINMTAFNDAVRKLSSLIVDIVSDGRIENHYIGATAKDSQTLKQAWSLAKSIYGGDKVSGTRSVEFDGQKVALIEKATPKESMAVQYGLFSKFDIVLTLSGRNIYLDVSPFISRESAPRIQEMALLLIGYVYGQRGGSIELDGRLGAGQRLVFTNAQGDLGGLSELVERYGSARDVDSRMAILLSSLKSKLPYLMTYAKMTGSLVFDKLIIKILEFILQTMSRSTGKDDNAYRRVLDDLKRIEPAKDKALPVEDKSFLAHKNLEEAIEEEKRENQERESEREGGRGKEGREEKKKPQVLDLGGEEEMNELPTVTMAADAAGLTEPAVHGVLELRMPHFTVSTNGVSILNKVEGNTMYTISRQTFGEVIAERLGRALRDEAGDDELVLRVMVGGKKISLDWQTREELTRKALERAVSEVADYLSLFADYEVTISSTDPLVLSLFRERADEKLQFAGGVIAEFANPGSIERLLKAFGTVSLRELPEAARGKAAELHFVVAGARKEEVAHALTARAIQPMAIAYENQLLIQKAERILSVLTGKTEHRYRGNEAVRARAELARLVSKLKGILPENDGLLRRATEHLEFMERMETIDFSDLLED